MINKNYEKVKNALMEHLLHIDLGKLPMHELTAYAAMVHQLSSLYEEKPDSFKQAAEMMSNYGIGTVSHPAPVKEA